MNVNRLQIKLLCVCVSGIDLCVYNQMVNFLPNVSTVLTTHPLKHSKQSLRPNKVTLDCLTTASITTALLCPQGLHIHIHIHTCTLFEHACGFIGQKNCEYVFGSFANVQLDAAACVCPPTHSACIPPTHSARLPAHTFSPFARPHIQPVCRVLLTTHCMFCYRVFY